MEQTILAHFDGTSIVPDEPVNFPVGERLRVRVELESATSAPFADLLNFATELDGAPTDLSTQHDHYLYGNPKR